MTDRRSFLAAFTALLTAPFAILTGEKKPGVPVLYGDGIHDDWPALQALLDGRDCVDARTGRVHRGVGFGIEGGHYRLSNSLRAGFPDQHGWGTVHNATFYGPTDDALWKFSSARFGL